MILDARLLALLSLSALAASARAQWSLEAFQGLYEGTENGNFTSSDGNGSANDAAHPFTVSRDFTGQGRDSVTRTMTVAGTAYSSSSVGNIHVFGEGTVTNAYYDASNTPVIDGNGDFDSSGSPYQLAVHGNAGWSDHLVFSGLGGDDYTVNFLFHLEGTVSGDTDTGLNFSTDRPGDPFYAPRMPTLDSPTQAIGLTWATPQYAVVDGQGFGINVDFYSGLTTNLVDHPDGSTIDGRADFANTLTLTGVVVRDSTGAPVTGYTITSDSNFAYPQAVPEPASLAALSLGALGLLRRRRKA